MNGVNELDHLWNPLSDFKMRYTPAYHRVQAQDVIRPWLISKKCYGTDELWWVILAWNGINSPLTELKEGDLLTIPNKIDIFDYQKRNKVR